MTVGELIEKLRDFDPSLEVVIELVGGEYAMLNGMDPPCGDEDRAQRGVCLTHGEYV